MAFIENREPIRAVETQQLLGAAVAGIVGLIGGSLITSVFRDDNTEEINILNNNIQKINSNLKFTNTRIDILAKNVTNSLNNIKIILNNINTFSHNAATKYTVTWHAEQLKQAASNLLIMFRVSENSLTLLRAGHINTNLLDMRTLKFVLAEGEKLYKNFEFPIKKLTKNNLKDILPLVKVNQVGRTNFLALIPLVHKNIYEGYTLVPHPITVKNGTLLMAEMNEVLLKGKYNYIIANNKDMNKIANNTYMANRELPTWSYNHKTCEHESVLGHTKSILVRCNFKKIGINTRDIHLTETMQGRMIYLKEKTTVELECPDQRVRDKLIGAHIIPDQCTLKTDKVVWPVKHVSNIDLTELVTKAIEGQTFDIKNIPPFHVNDSNEVHDSIRELLDEVATDPLTITIHDRDFTLQDIGSYGTIAMGTITILTLLNFVIIMIIVCIIARKAYKNRSNHRLAKMEEKLRNKLRGKLAFSPRDSLRLSGRNTFRRARSKINNLSQRSSTSLRSSLKRAKGQLGKIQQRVGTHKHNTISTPNIVDSATNTETLYPSITSKRITKNHEMIPMEAY